MQIQDQQATLQNDSFEGPKTLHLQETLENFEGSIDDYNESNPIGILGTNNESKMGFAYMMRNPLL